MRGRAKRGPIAAFLSAKDQDDPGKRIIWAPNPCQWCLVDGKPTGMADGAACVHCRGTKHGPQWDWLVSLAFEILGGGSKGGGKSHVGSHFLIGGNQKRGRPLGIDWEKEPPNSVHRSYIFHPRYRGLALRETMPALRDWIDEADVIFRLYGGDWRKADGEWLFPSGAKIGTGHLEDAQSYKRYTGHAIHRVFIDQVEQIPALRLYDEIRSCVRSVYPEIYPQIFLTCNWVGAGAGWLADRFNALDETSWGKVIEEEIADPFTGEKEKVTRVFIPAGLRDNPYLLRNRDYVMNLASITDPKLRDAYLFGRPDALMGGYFQDFRAKRREDEPPEASHVVAAADHPLGFWWPREMGGDWGYDHEAAFYWSARRPTDGRLLLYREMVFNRVGAVEAGVEIARASAGELAALPGGTMRLHFSHEAFGKRDERSTVELLAEGIGRVLGPRNVHIPELELAELEQRIAGGAPNLYREHLADYRYKIEKRKRHGIVIVRAQTARIIGWQHCREMLRWRTLDPAGQSQWDDRFYRSLAVTQGMEKALEYKALFDRAQLEPLPKLLIFDLCPRLISTIPRCQYDPGTEDVLKFPGDDPADAWRYLLMGLRNAPVEEPFEAAHAQMVAAYTALHPTAGAGEIIQLTEHFERTWAPKTSQPIYIPTAARGMRWASRTRLT